MKKFTLLFVAAMFSALSFAALNPFAYGLSSSLNTDQTELTINYSLNATAKNVDFVLLDGDKVIKTVNLNDKGLDKGSYTATVALDDPNMPLGKKLTWKLEVKGAAHNTTNNHGGYQFYHPSGVDVDNNPESPHFGRIICNEAMQRVEDQTTKYISAGFGAGIFAFTPAFDPIVNGDKPGFNGGITFPRNRPGKTGTGAAATAYVPRRVRISEDGRIFVTSLNTDGGPYLWEVNADNLDQWTPVFQSSKTSELAEMQDANGNFIAGPNVGFDVRGSGDKLQLLMLSGNTKAWDAAFAAFKCSEYNLGTKTSWETVPTKIRFENKYVVNYSGSQVQYDQDGGIWLCQNRGTATDDQPALVHWDTNGNEDYKKKLNGLTNAGFRFNNDFTKVIIADAKPYAKIYKVSKDNSGPVLTLWKTIDMTDMGANLNDFAWDIADNVYAVGNSSEWIRAYALARTADDIATTPCASKYAFVIPAPAQLNPFAYKLSSELSADEKNLTIKYSLNALATSVNWVLLDGETPIKTVDLSSLGLAKGDYTTTISTTDFPQYKALTWKIEVKGVAVDEVTAVKGESFYRPFGVDIDNNPENPHFGRILCGETYTSSDTKYASCGVGSGIYEYSPAFELIPNGTKPGYNGGKTFTEHSPYRIRISEDGRIFVTAHDQAGEFLWEVNPDNLNEWTSVFQGATHNTSKLLDASGKFIAGTNAGFDVRGTGENLQLLMLSCDNLGTNAANFQCHEYNLGTAKTWNTTPSKAISGSQLYNTMISRYSQVLYDKEGGFWEIYYINTSLLGGIAHFAKQADGSYVKDYVKNKIMLRAGGCAFNHDFSKLILCGDVDVTTNSPGSAVIYSVSKDADGKPVLTKETTINTAVVGGNLNDFAWDYANNIYVVGNNGELLQVYALPHSSDDVVATPAASKYTFSIGKYSMIVNTNDENKGTVTGAGEYKVGETATLTATAKEGYKLLYWSDRSTENPRTIIMNKNEAISAYFVKEYDEEQTFTITQVWENTNVPEKNTNGYQAVGWDEKVYLQASADSKIKVYSNREDAPTEYATSGAGYQIAVDEVGNLIVFNAYFATATPGNVLIYKKGSTTGKTVTFTLPNPGRCDFFSASGDIYSAEGGYVYFYCNTQTVVNRVKITNGAATDADVTIDVVGENLVTGCTQNHVVVDIFGNLLAQSRLNGVRAVNVHTDEAKSFFLPEHKTNTLGGCSFELGGKEFWAYNVGTEAYTSEWKLYNITDKTFLSETTLYAKNTTETNKNQAANWLNVQVVDENTAYIYQYCPTVAVALWKVSRDIKYNVSATAENGTVTGAGKYKEGTTATLTAAPNARYDFVNWTKGGVEVSTDATYSFEVTEDVELTANFSKKPDIAYELNGGQWNEYGWVSKKDMYDAFVADWKEYSNSVQYFCPYETQLGIGNSNQGLPTAILGTQDILGFMAQEKWAWLGKFLDALATAQGRATMPTAATTQMRFALGNFFGEDNNNATSWVGAVDCSAGQADPDAFQPTWGHLLSNPTQPTTAVVLGNPCKENYLFGGWYAEADFSGVVVTTIDENTEGTLYAKWVEHFYTRDVTNGEYGTICLPYASSNHTGAEFYEIAYLELASDGITPKTLYLDEVTTPLQAGKPYIFRATSNKLIAHYEGEKALSTINGKAGLTGTFENIPLGNTILEDNYMIAQNKFWLCGPECSLRANRAYIEHNALHENTTPVAKIPGRRRVSMGAAGENVATGTEEMMIPIDQTIKIIEDGQLIIIRDGEKYNVHGMKL